jgi:hypothetical protein
MNTLTEQIDAIKSKLDEQIQKAKDRCIDSDDNHILEELNVELNRAVNGDAVAPVLTNEDY